MGAQSTESALLARRGVVRGDEMTFTCPESNKHRTQDAHPSARFNTGKRVYCCPVCNSKGNEKQLRELLGLGTIPKYTGSRREYAYHSAESAIVAVHVRHQRGGKKFFTWELPNGVRGLAGQKLSILPLYNLPEILKAPVEHVVVITEGERDADTLRKAGLTSTTLPTGAGVSKLAPQWISSLRGRPVVVLPDNDPPGAHYVDVIANTLAGQAASVKVARVPEQFKDVSEWVEEGASDEQLKVLIAEAKLIEPPGEERKSPINEVQQVILGLPNALVLGEYEGRIHLYDTELRRHFEVENLKDLDYPTFGRYFGNKASYAIRAGKSEGEDDLRITVTDARFRIAVAARKRRLTARQVVGQGI